MRRAALAFALLTLVPAARGLVPDPSQEQAEELSPVVDWVLRTGVSTVIRSNITRAAGLGEIDVPVRGRGFFTRGARFTEVFAVASELSDVVIIARVDEADGSAIAWRTSRAGRLEATVSFLPPAEPRRVHPSAEQTAQFQDAKRYFRQMMTIKSAAPKASP